MKYENYDRISDSIFNLDGYTHLMFNMKLKYKTNDEIHKSHQEFERNGNIMVRRIPNYYFTFERFYGDSKFKTTLNISEDWISFKDMCKRAMLWYTKDNILMVIQNNDLKFNKSVEPLQIKVSFGKYLAIEPVFITSKIPGFRLYFETKEIYSDIAIDRFRAFIALMNGFDPISYGAIMMNYIKPQMGYNLLSYTQMNNPDGY